MIGKFLYSESMHTSSWRTRIFVGLFFVVLAGFLTRVFQQTDHVYGGDEPHYLVMAESIVVDRDLDLAPDYASERYRAYYGGHLDPHISNNHQPDNATRAYSIHGYGMGWLLAVPFALGGPAGVDIAMALIGFGVCIALYAWVRQITHSHLAAGLSVVGLATSPVFLANYGYIYPDLPVAGLLLFGLLVLGQRPAVGRYLLFSLIAGGAVWLHFKTVFIFAPLALWALGQIWRERMPVGRAIAHIGALVGPGIVSFGLMLLAFQRWYNVWVPSQIYPPTAKLGDASPFITLPAMLWDADKGVLTTSWFFWLAFVCLPIVFVARRQLFWLIVVATLPTVALLATFSDWSGGYAPMGRYLLEILPVLAGGIGLVFALGRNRVLSLLAGLLVIGQFALALMVVATGAQIVILGVRNPIFPFIEERFGVAIDQYLAHFTLTDVIDGSISLSVMILLAIVAISFGMSWAASFIKGDRTSETAVDENTAVS